MATIANVLISVDPKTVPGSFHLRGRLRVSLVYKKTNPKPPHVVQTLRINFNLRQEKIEI